MLVGNDRKVKPCGDNYKASNIERNRAAGARIFGEAWIMSLRPATRNMLRRTKMRTGPEVRVVTPVMDLLEIARTTFVLSGDRSRNRRPSPLLHQKKSY